jgi:23S rRNA (adenine2503-C2)-methyltransferase
MSLPFFNNLSPAAWRAEAAKLGLGSGQTRNFLRAVYQTAMTGWDDVQAPQRQKNTIRKHFALAPLPTVISRKESTDGTVKFLLAMEDGKSVEAVHIPEGTRGTVCISSQVGCAIGCDFCFTAKMGLMRNLQAHEIIGQWMRVRTELPDRPFTNIVFMGMGEPLHNLDNVLTALEILIPARRITVSTSGLLPGIKKLLARSSVRLALSVNGSNPDGRRKVMPIEKAYPIEEILDYLRGFTKGNHHHPMFEYVMLGEENDRDEDVESLIKLLEGVPGRVNLIPFNPHPGSDYRRPADERVMHFHKRLRATGRHVFIRQSRGRDVLAACGQLHHEKAAAGI